MSSAKSLSSVARVMVPHDSVSNPCGTPCRAQALQNPCACSQLLEAIEQGDGVRRRRRRRQAERLKPYVAAQVDVLPTTFTLGDKKNYQGFYNRPLSPDLSYQCFVLASLKEPMDQVSMQHLRPRLDLSPGHSQALRTQAWGSTKMST